jgi:hypothetical protein
MNVKAEMVQLGWSPFWTKYGEGRLARGVRTRYPVVSAEAFSVVGGIRPL